MNDKCIHCVLSSSVDGHCRMFTEEKKPLDCKNWLKYPRDNVDKVVKEVIEKDEHS